MAAAPTQGSNTRRITTRRRCSLRRCDIPYQAGYMAGAEHGGCWAGLPKNVRAQSPLVCHQMFPEGCRASSAGVRAGVGAALGTKVVAGPYRQSKDRRWVG